MYNWYIESVQKRGCWVGIYSIASYCKKPASARVVQSGPGPKPSHVEDAKLAILGKKKHGKAEEDTSVRTEKEKHAKVILLISSMGRKR